MSSRPSCISWEDRAEGAAERDEDTAQAGARELQLRRAGVELGGSGQESNLYQRSGRRGGRFAQHVGGGNARPVVGFFAVRSRRAAHTPLHVRQPRTTRATANVAA